MRVEAGPYRCEGTDDVIHAERPLSREQVDLIVGLCRGAGVDIHQACAVQMTEGRVTVEAFLDRQFVIIEREAVR